MKLEELRKEDYLYYQGAFWIDGESVREIKRGYFKIIGAKFPCYYTGEYSSLNKSKNSLTHRKLWPEYNQNYLNKPYNYLPRGRVAIHQGVAYIHLNSLFNQPSIIDTLIKEYNLEKLEIELDLNDTYQGSHYDFLFN